MFSNIAENVAFLVDLKFQDSCFVFFSKYGNTNNVMEFTVFTSTVLVGLL